MSALERLFLFVKNLARQEVDSKLQENVDSLLSNVACEEEKVFVLKMFLLICIMKRTHLTSQAPGVAAGGCGEKKQLREAVVYFSKLGYAELVQSVLRIMPIYGCWSDLRIVGEELYLFHMDGKQEELEVEEFPVLKSICSIFAEQFVKDHHTLLESSYTLPSTAFKYCFHFSRHDNHRTAVLRNKMKRVNEGKFTPQMKFKKRKLPDSAKEKNRQAYAKRKLAESKKKTEKKIEEIGNKCNRLPLTCGKSPIHKANVCLSSYLASKFLFPGQSFPSQNALESAYRNYFKPLRQRVLERKACLENFMCKQLWNKISFVHAPKGAVDRMKKALEKHGQKKRMLAAMRKNSDAIPNIEDIGKYIDDLMEEFEAIAGVSLEQHLLSLASANNNGHIDVVVPTVVMEEMIAPLIISKSILTLTSQRLDILSQTKAMYAKISNEQDLTVTELPCAPIIDTMNCVNWAEKAQLVLAGYMVAVVNGVGLFYVDGKECCVNIPKAAVAMEEEKPTTRTGKKQAVSLAADPLLWLQFVPLDFEENAAPASETLERLTKGVTGILEHVLETNTDKIATRGVVDILLLCRDFTVDPTLFSSWLTVQQSQGLRDLQIHRVRRASRQNNADCHPFQPRKLQLPTHDAIVRSEITLDFVICLDLTGSMQPYIDAARKYLLEIIEEVKSATGVKDVRFAFVGYRDYCDRKNIQQPRFVVHDFTLNPQGIITAIQTQRASGGGDCPEDLLGGIVKVMDLSWQSPIRVMAIVTDAPQHGFTDSSSGDDHPDGRCPDQQSPHPSFPEAFAKLANVLAVDTLFVRCSSGTKSTEEAIARVYPGDGREGFGVLPMENGATELKTVLCDGLSSAVNYLFSPPDQVGISTLEGNTLSALASSSCQSLRQSIRDQFPSSIASPVLTSDGVEEVEKEASAMIVKEKVVSVEREEDALTEEENDDDDDEDDWDATEKKEKEAEKAMETEGKKVGGGMTDYETLLQHLQQDFLSVAREALGLTVEEIAEKGLKIIKASSDMVVEECDEDEEDKKREEQTLTDIAQSLMGEGVTYAELCDEKAPTEVLQRFVEEVKTQIERI